MLFVLPSGRIRSDRCHSYRHRTFRLLAIPALCSAATILLQSQECGLEIFTCRWSSSSSDSAPASAHSVGSGPARKNNKKMTPLGVD